MFHIISDNGAIALRRKVATELAAYDVGTVGWRGRCRSSARRISKTTIFTNTLSIFKRTSINYTGSNRVTTDLS